jgi:hypothetical protein
LNRGLTNPTPYVIINVSNEREELTMRTVNYRLSDGTMTSSFEIAKASGMSFTTHLEEVRTPRVSMSAARKAKIEEFFARKRK